MGLFKKNSWKKFMSDPLRVTAAVATAGNSELLRTAYKEFTKTPGSPDMPLAPEVGASPTSTAPISDVDTEEERIKKLERLRAGLLSTIKTSASGVQSPASINKPTATGSKTTLG